jgi:hypothetical protein
MGETRNAYKILVGKSGGKRPRWRRRRRWANNITSGIKEIGCEGVSWINLDQDSD